MCNPPPLWHQTIISLEGMSLRRQHQTHNQHCNLQPDKYACAHTHKHTHRVKLACVHKRGVETAREADEIKRFQTGGNAIKGDGENRHFCTKEHLIWSVCVCGCTCVFTFSLFFLCHTDQNIRRGQPTDSLDTGAAPFLKHFLLS